MTPALRNLASLCGVNPNDRAAMLAWIERLIAELVEARKELSK